MAYLEEFTPHVMDEAKNLRKGTSHQTEIRARKIHLSIKR